MQVKQKKVQKRNDENSIIQVLASYIPYWPLFVIFLSLSVIGAFFYLRYTLPKYQATAKIIIKDEKKGYDDSKLMESLDLINTKKIIENEIEVLQSKTLMNTVVKKLHLYAPIFQEGKLRSISAYTLSPVKVEALHPDSLRNFKKIDLQFDEKNGSVILGKSLKCSLNQWVNTPYGILKFTHNDKYSPGKESRPFYFSLLNIKAVSSWILSDLKVGASSKLSSVIDLNLRDEVPKRAEDILDGLITAYSDAAIAEKNNLARNTLSLIEERLKIVSNDLNTIEERLQQYKAGKGAVDISRQGQIYLENVSVNDKRLSDLNIQVDALDQLEKAASSQDNKVGIASTLGVNDPTLIQQMSKLSELQMQYDKLKTTVAENNPMLIQITDQINQIKPTILSNIQSQRKSLEQSKGNLYATGGNYNSMLSSIPQKERQLVEITRDQNIKNGIYSFLLQKREESELSYASNIADSKVVNFAQASNSPVTPKRMMIYMMALAFGIGFPIAFITGRDILSPKILYRNEIEALTDLPIIGEIGFNQAKDALVAESGKRTVGAEEFRKLRISLLSMGIDSRHKKILVTSSISGEGKSFISANLASSISLTGKKVALVDLDLHNPGLGKYFGMGEHPGVSDYLIGKNTIAQIINNVKGNDNLFFISSGTLQEDASELLENGKVQNLIEQLDADFDVVIIDTAPIVLITDAYLLSSLCDATLYVVRHKFTPKMMVKRIDENIEINPIKNPAILFNGVKTRGFFKNNYGYGYNNYVYSYDNKKKKKSIA